MELAVIVFVAASAGAFAGASFAVLRVQFLAEWPRPRGIRVADKKGDLGRGTGTAAPVIRAKPKPFRLRERWDEAAAREERRRDSKAERARKLAREIEAAKRGETNGK